MKFFVFLFFFFSLNASERHIALITYKDFKGEYSFALRIQAACRNINWDADIYELRDPVELNDKNYDFVINLVPGQYNFPNCKNYLAIFHPEHHFFENEILKPEYRSYDGYLLSYTPKANFNYPYLLWYPTAQHRAYTQVQPQHLFYIGSLWGNRFESKKIKTILRKLDDEPYMKCFGDPIFKKQCPQSYQGAIPFDADSLCNVISDCGITLILHSSDHIKAGVPSGRIFEAVSASSVVISDQNPFVMKHFKDSVLYIDTKSITPYLCKKIKEHVNWIKRNPEKALSKTKQAHEIFENEFLLEDQLLRLEKFHQELTHASSQ